MTKNKLILFFGLVVFSCVSMIEWPVSLNAQNLSVQLADSTEVAAHSSFNEVGKWHRFFFGENYRKEWAAVTRLPVIHLSSFQGGLAPVKEGGGNQTHSLRLSDSCGMEWVLRSVEKYPDAILPEDLKNTFVGDLVNDAMSAQHPYGALIVPPIAQAVGVPHANPVIGIIAPDPMLGIYSKTFAGSICLLEEREPNGKSVNYLDMLAAMNADNDNQFDSTIFLRARILDLLIGDWDRHGDQWRFVPLRDGMGKKYVPVPRDRDQVFYTNQGVFPFLESRPYVAPFFEGFNPRVRNTGTFFFTSTLLNARFLNQFSYIDWMRITGEFVHAVTDSVLEEALKLLPSSAYSLRHDQLLKTLKQRREDLPRAMSDYYYFLNKSVFIQTSDQNEFIRISDTLQNLLSLSIFSMSDEGTVSRIIFSRVYDPRITKEIRFFIGRGNDRINIDNRNSDIRLRFSGREGPKHFNLVNAEKKVNVFETDQSATFSGNQSRIKKHISNDSANTAIVPGNLFNVVTPFIDFGFNPDDGVLIGGVLNYTRGVDYTTTTFSTKKYTSFQQFGFSHSFSTKAFEAKYNAEWVKLVGRADLIVHANVNAPNNTENYFGTGNESSFLKTDNYKHYYRARFSLYKLSSFLRWGEKGKVNFSFGPSLQYYTFDSADNIGRFIETPSAVQTYDSNSLSKSKLQAGVILEFRKDTKDNPLLPTKGYFIDIRLQGYLGANRLFRIVLTNICQSWFV